jgi:hypothetical protein
VNGMIKGMTRAKIAVSLPQQLVDRARQARLVTLLGAV